MFLDSFAQVFLEQDILGTGMSCCMEFLPLLIDREHLQVTAGQRQNSFSW